jgi:hypothetical protein
VLTKKDKEWIQDTFRELLTEALTVDIMMERKRDPETGIPLKTPLVENKSVYLPAHWVEFLPFYEQSIVAMETVTEQARNRSGSGLKELKQLQEKVDAIGNLYIGLEKPLKAVAALSDAIQNKKLPTMTEVLNLEYAEESD